MGMMKRAMMEREERLMCRAEYLKDLLRDIVDSHMIWPENAEPADILSDAADLIEDMINEVWSNR